MSIIVIFLVYFLIFYVVSYILCEYGQAYLYDEVTPKMPLKVLAGSLIMAVGMTIARPRLDTMFTSDLGWTVILSIASMVIFTAAYQFQPWHAAGFGLAAFLFVGSLATTTGESLTTSSADPRTTSQAKRAPVRVIGGRVVGPDGKVVQPAAPAAPAGPAPAPAPGAAPDAAKAK